MKREEILWERGKVNGNEVEVEKGNNNNNSEGIECDIESDDDVKTQKDEIMTMIIT